jgi:hypothetical protein
MRNWSFRLLSFAFLVCMRTSGQSFQDEEANSTDCHIVRASDLADLSAPRFDSFPIDVTRSDIRAPLDLRSNRIARTYRTVLRQEINKGPNYAGHYRVAIWGCGSSCAMFAVVNLKSGKVITPVGYESVSGVDFGVEGFLPDAAASGAWGFRFKKDSRLLVIIGAPNEDDVRHGAFYFVLNNDKLVLEHTTAVKKTCVEQRK